MSGASKKVFAPAFSETWECSVQLGSERQVTVEIPLFKCTFPKDVLGDEPADQFWLTSDPGIVLEGRRTTEGVEFDGIWPALTYRLLRTTADGTQATLLKGRQGWKLPGLIPGAPSPRRAPASAGALVLKPITLKAINRGGYDIRVGHPHGMAPMRKCELELCHGGIKARIDITRGYGVTRRAELLEMIRKIGGFGKTVQARAFAQFVSTDGSMEELSSLPVAFPCPVAPMRESDVSIRGIGALAALQPPIVYPGGGHGRLLTQDIGGFCYFRHGSLFETSPAFRGFDCITYVGCAYRAHSGMGERGDGLAEVLHAEKCGIEGVSWAEAQKALLAPENSGASFIVWTKSHVVAVVSGEVHEFTNREPAGYHVTRLNAWKERSGMPVWARRLPGPEKPAAKQTEEFISELSIEFIFCEETLSKAYYERHASHPHWPQGNSGITIGIGYDLGYQTLKSLTQDFDKVLTPAQVKILEPALKVTGVDASKLLSESSEIKQIKISFDDAYRIFKEKVLPRYIRLTRKIFGEMTGLHPHSRGALVSLVYNRGNQLAGERRKEMREIQRILATKDGDLKAISTELRKMQRLWLKGSALWRRRESEAQLFERGQAS